MRQIHGILTLAALATLTTLATARADTLIMEGLQQAQATAAERPSRGMNMRTVASRWGEPATKAPPVGQPPITRWDYNGFSVFFEYDHVVHAVARR